MSKHIRGPWKLGTLTEFGVRRYTCIYADTPESPGGKTIVIRTGIVRGEAEAASVKLATAAPELLEALESVKTYLEDCLCDRQQIGLPSRTAYDRVCAAIAKATAE